MRIIQFPSLGMLSRFSGCVKAGRHRFQQSCLLMILLGIYQFAIAHTPNNEAKMTIPEVVITIQSQRQALEQVPIAMTVVDATTLAQTHAETLSAMQQLVPNFSIATPSGDSAITIRGIGGGGRNVGFDPRVGVYLDGVYIGQSQALNLSLFDIERVEVLRGPQGYLFGRNTVAGAVNITTKPPSDQFEAYIKTSYASYNTFENAASVSGPISETTQGKLSLDYTSRNGFSQNLYNNDRLDNLNRLATRGQLSFQPSDRLNVDIFADYADIRQNNLYAETTSAMFGLPLKNGQLPDHTVNIDLNPYVHNKLSGVSATVNYELSGGNTLTSISAYRYTYQDKVIDDDFTTANLFNVRFTDNFHQTSQELRFASPLEQKFRYVSGIYLMHENAASYRTATFGADTNTTLVQFPTIPAPIVFGTLLGVNAGGIVPVTANVNTHSYAMFGSVDYDIFEFLSFNLGARYTYEQKDLLYNIDGTQSGGVGIGTVADYRDHFSDNYLSPTIGFTLKLDNTDHVYAKYSSGFKSGGWNADFLTSTQIARNIRFNKETVDSYEIGIKGSALNRHLQYELALFQSEYQDYQAFQLQKLGVGQYEIQLRNAALAASKGAEASVTTLITDWLKIGANFGLLDARFKSFPSGLSGGLDATGKRLPEAPEVTAALTIAYTIPAPLFHGKFEWYGEQSYRSKSSSGVDADPSIFAVGSRNIVNTRLSFIPDDGHLELSLWATNLFDAHYVTARARDFLGVGVLKRGDPQTIGIEGKYNF